MTTRACIKLTALALTAALLSGVVLRPQDGIDPEKYARVKAAMVLNFARYTTWPSDKFDDSEGELAPIIILVLGRDAMQEELERLIRDEEVGGRRLRLRVTRYPEPNPSTRRVEQSELDRFNNELREAHLLFLAEDEAERLREVLGVVREDNVLTTSDIEDFAERGGMLGLAVRSNRVAIDANVGEIEETELEVSAKLLRLARIVATREEDQR